MIGGVAGAVLGLVNFFLLQWVAEQVELGKARSQQAGSARILRLVAWADLAVFPVLAYVLGPMVLR